MRKGLVLTLGVVALVLVVSPGFAVAPIISCVPDIIVSDFEDSQTIDNNLFVFSDALDLDEYVQDLDTTDTSLLRWSFVQSSGPAIEMNGIGSNTSGNTLAPGAFDIRAVDNMVDVRNVDWSPVAAALPNADPPSASADSMIELYVSDGTNEGSQAVTITSIDDDASGDRLIPQASSSYTFASDSQGWTWFNDASLQEPTRTAGSGALTINLATPGTNVVFGSWESPKDPAVAEQPRFGCILRGRFLVSSSADGATVPGIRMRAVTTKVTDTLIPGSWTPDFLSRDLNSDLTVNYFTPDTSHVPGREPGIAGKTYDILSWPQQVDSLMSTTTITYFSCDMLDLDVAFTNDSGVITISQVDFDGIDRPAAGTGQAEAALSFTDFTSWSDNVTALATGAVLPVFTVNASEVSLACALGTQLYDAAALSPAAPMVPGRYYRAIFTVSSTAQPTGDFGPTFRLGFVSSAFAFSADKNLAGGGLLSAIGTTPEPFEVWTQAPPATAATTEDISVRFQSWLLTSNTGFPFNKNVSGTIRATEVAVDSFDPPAAP